MQKKMLSMAKSIVNKVMFVFIVFVSICSYCVAQCSSCLPGGSYNYSTNQTISTNTCYNSVTMSNNKLITITSGVTLTICGDFNGLNGDGITVNSGGSLIITGELELNNNFTLIVNGTALIGNISVGNSGVFNVMGEGSIEVTGNVVAGNNASVSVASGGIFEVDGNLSIGSGTITSNGLLDVNGTISGTTVSGTGTWCNSPTTSSVVTGDFVWRGVLSSNWSTTGNWLIKTSTGYSDAVTLPESTKNVIIAGVTGCSNSNSPSIIPSTLDIKNLTIESGASLNIASGLINVYGNWTNNGTYISNTNSTVAFKGSVSQTVNGTVSTTFGNVTMNNSAGLTVSKGLTINNVLTFTSGNILAASSVEAVTFGTSGTVSGVANTKCIVGYCKKNTNSTTKFTFPVGTSTLYRPASITPSSSSSTTWTAKYYGTGYGDYSVITTNGALHHPSSREYWTIDRSGASNASIELSWGSNSNVDADFADLVVVHYNGTDWGNAGGNGISGSASVGVVSSNSNWSSYSPFTLGSKTGSVPLPITLISFEVKPFQNDVKVFWQTASEQENDFFTVERSINGYDFRSIGSVDGAGNSSQLITYELFDKDYENTINYYRLKLIDFNGQELYSKIASVDMSKNQFYFVNTINSLGQEVDETAKVIVFDIYSDGTSVKRIQL